MTSDTPKNAPKGLRPLKGPMVVRHRDAARFLWGDGKSQEVADVVYGRNEVIGTLLFKLRPGGYFKSSDTWKSYFDQDRFYYVVKGEIAVQDPETGEIVVARAGEAVHWRGAKWHFGYNFSANECVVLDWYAPQERPPSVTELEFGTTKPKFTTEKPGRTELLGKWPAMSAAARAEAQSKGGMITATKENALHFVHGDAHPGGKLHVYLPDTYDWFELDEWDLLYLPPGVQHQYWNYTDRPLSFAFLVVPKYA